MAVDPKTKALTKGELETLEGLHLGTFKLAGTTDRGAEGLVQRGFISEKTGKLTALGKQVAGLAGLQRTLELYAGYADQIASLAAEIGADMSVFEGG